MSRIGKLPITVPSGVDVAIDGRTVTVKGPKGTLSHTVIEPITVERDDSGAVVVKRPDDERRSKAYHDSVVMPHSKLKTHVAEILQQEGYISGWSVNEPAEGEVGKNLVLDLKYGPNRERSIAGIKRVSKPGLRVYAKSTGLPRVLGGLGIAIISTSSGLQTERQAYRNGVGGEVLAYVW